MSYFVVEVDPSDNCYVDAPVFFETYQLALEHLMESFVELFGLDSKVNIEFCEDSSDIFFIEMMSKRGSGGLYLQKSTEDEITRH